MLVHSIGDCFVILKFPDTLSHKLHAKIAGVFLMEHWAENSQNGSAQNQFVVQEEKFVFQEYVYSYFIM